MDKAVKKIFITQWKDKRIKKTLVLGFLAMLITNLLILFIVGKNINQYHDYSIINNTDIKYIIPSPSINQIEELGDKDYVSNINATSFLNLDVIYKEKIIKTPTVLIDSMDNLENTPFSKKRLIKGEAFLKTNTVFVDYLFVKNNNVKLSDTIKLKLGEIEKSYIISGIYETNTLVNSDVGSVFIYKSSEIINILTDNGYELIITNAYLNATNKIETDYFTDYKAYGRLRDRSEFPSDESYEIHYNNFMNANFSNEIIYFKQEIYSSNPIYIVLTINSLILLFLSMHNYLYLNSKNEQTFIRKITNYGKVKNLTKNRNKVDMPLITYYRITYLIEVLFIIILAVIPTVLYVLIINSRGIYVPKLYKYSYFSSIIIPFLISVIINFFITNKLKKQLKTGIKNDKK